MKQIRMAWRVSTSTGNAPVHTGQWIPDTPRNRQILEQSAKAANSIVDGSIAVSYTHLTLPTTPYV